MGSSRDRTTLLIAAKTKLKIIQKILRGRLPFKAAESVVSGLLWCSTRLKAVATEQNRTFRTFQSSTFLVEPYLKGLRSQKTSGRKDWSLVAISLIISSDFPIFGRLLLKFPLIWINSQINQNPTWFIPVARTARLASDFGRLAVLRRSESGVQGLKLRP